MGIQQRIVSIGAAVIVGFFGPSYAESGGLRCRCLHGQGAAPVTERGPDSASCHSSNYRHRGNDGRDTTWPSRCRGAVARALWTCRIPAVYLYPQCLPSVRDAAVGTDYQFARVPDALDSGAQLESARCETSGARSDRYDSLDAAPDLMGD